ncbi:MAG: hypothetical protein ACTSUC_09605 [Promethearchaeota archaeon]
MTLTNANIFSSSYAEIKSFLEGISGLDPKGRDRVNWIHSSMPNVNASGFAGYPFIILRVDVSEEEKSFNPNISNKIFRVLLQIYSNESTDIDSISDKIHDNFRDETKLVDFEAREISSSPFQYDLDLNGKKIVFRNIGLILKSRI